MGQRIVESTTIKITDSENYNLFRSRLLLKNITISYIFNLLVDEYVNNEVFRNMIEDVVDRRKNGSDA